MEFTNKQQSFFILYPNKGELYTSKSLTPMVIDFPNDIIEHQELINSQRLHDLIESVLAANSVVSTPLYLFLSPEVTYEDILEDIPLSLQNSEIQTFLDMVPHSQTLHRTYTLKKQTITVATNKEFCHTIVAAFSSAKLEVMAIIPLSIVYSYVPELKQEFNFPAITRAIDDIKRYNLLDVTSSRNRLPTPPRQKTPWKHVFIVGTLVSLISGFILKHLYQR